MPGYYPRQEHLATATGLPPSELETMAGLLTIAIDDTAMGLANEVVEEMHNRLRKCFGIPQDQNVAAWSREQMHAPLLSTVLATLERGKRCGELRAIDTTRFRLPSSHLAAGLFPLPALCLCLSAFSLAAFVPAPACLGVGKRGVMRKPPPLTCMYVHTTHALTHRHGCTND